MGTQLASVKARRHPLTHVKRGRGFSAASSLARSSDLSSGDHSLMWRKPTAMRPDDAACMNQTSHFQQFLQAAESQPEPQRLLFVFATAELPEDATADQTERFAAGAGGTLTPLMTADKGVGELTSFDALVAESREAGDASSAWHVVFAAGLGGRNGQSPNSDQVDAALRAMVEGVRVGRVENFLALDRFGEALQFV
jgi:hypothetical protein